MKLGLRLNLYRSAALDLPVALVRHAESIGFHSVWTAEAYGADALTPLAYLAACTERIKLATGVVQLAARPPAALAMQAMTIDALAGGGRTIIGIGLSGPQIVEGWYGQPWGRPHARLRDYVQIVRKVLARDAPLTHDGPEITLPYTGPGAIGQGKALKSILHPVAPIEVWIGAGGPRNTALAAELADGWLPMGLGPEGIPPAARERRDLEVFVELRVRITDDVRSTLDGLRPLTAMYVAGMGSETHNYHRDAMARQGFAEAADRIGELWRAGRRAEAEAAVPPDYLEQSLLCGSAERIRGRWADGGTRAHMPGVTGVIVDAPQPEALELMAAITGAREEITHD